MSELPSSLSFVHADRTIDPSENDQVRLNQDIPELGLRRGDVGVICSKWFAPTHAYEVEFEPTGLSFRTRVLLMSNQIALEKTGV